MIHAAPLHDEHLDLDLSFPSVTKGHDVPADEVYVVVSEKHGEDNTGYLVSRLEAGRNADYWCACGDFRFRCVDDDGTIVGECKHVEAVKLRTRRSVESDQATLGGVEDDV